MYTKLNKIQENLMFNFFVKRIQYLCFETLNEHKFDNLKNPCFNFYFTTALTPSVFCSLSLV